MTEDISSKDARGPDTAKRAKLRLAIVEPWFGESHKDQFAGVARHSRHHTTLITLPARKWRWRMRTGAIHLRSQLSALETRPDALLVSDYVNLPALKGFCPDLSRVPAAVYFMENQLTYPTRDSAPVDFEFQSINLLTCLVADRVVFCSAQQRDALLDAAPAMLRHDPDARIDDILDTIREKSTVVPIGVDMTRFDDARERRVRRTGKPLRIVWPHRFEHDKNPQTFCEVVRELDREHLPFELLFLGRAYRDIPEVLMATRRHLAHRIVHFGFLSGSQYAEALAGSDVVVSTALQETQGLAVIEAVRAGCDPLLPDRLSYPEVLGPELASKHLYRTTGDLRRRLRWMMRNPDRVRGTADHWRAMTRFAWEHVAPILDNLMAEMALAGRTR